MQSKLGNIPMIRPGGGPLIKKPLKQEEKPTLDHDLAMDKPSLARKRSPEAKKQSI